MSRIFISHSSRDAFAALALRDWLTSEGWDDVFLDLDPERGIAAGERWERSLHQAANRCEAVVFLISAHWLASGWCLREYNLARGLNKKLFAALIDPDKSIADLPPELSGTWQVVNLAGGQDLRLFPVRPPGSHEEAHVGFSADGLRRLRQGLRKAGLDARFFAWPPDDDLQRPPYRGLKPLEAADAGIFFGRDGPIVETIDRLRGVRAGAPPRLLAILGASGAGKSSFLRAGLLPRLARDDTHFVPLAPIRPERGALTGENGLLRALETACPGSTRADLRKAMNAGAAGLRPILRALAAHTLARTLAESDSSAQPAIVLSIDQAEELFRADGGAEAAALLALVHDLTEVDDPAVIVIFAIRSDSYDALEHAKPLEGVPQATLPLLPLPQGAYKEVIERPVQRAADAGRRLAIEPRLTQRLLEDIEKGGGSDALPLLAFTLEQLYLEYHRSGALRLADYEAVGGLRGTIDAAVERALARADQDARIPRERAAREALLRRGLIPWLAGVDPDTRSPRRNIARRADIPAEAAPLIDLLVEERLLSTDTTRVLDPTTGEVSRVATIEPTHEALLRQWGLLEGWLADDFGLLAALEGLKRATRDWEANARDDAWLAHQGQRLADAQALDTRPDIAARLDAADRAYLAACQRREEAARAEAEQRRAERAQEQERRIADANALTAATRRTAQRTRIGLAAALLLAAAAGAFGLYAKAQKGIADVRTREAKQQRDAAKAAKDEAQTQRDLARNALKKATETANRLIFDVAGRFRYEKGMRASLTGEVLDQVLKLQDDLLRSGLSDDDLLRSRNVALNEASTTLLTVGETAKAIAYAEKAVATIRKLLLKQPQNTTWRADLGVSLTALGTAELKAEQLEAAQRDFVESVSVLGKLASETKTLGDLSSLATAFERVGTVRLQMRDVEGARAVFEKEIALFGLLIKNSDNPEYKRGRFVAMQLLAQTKDKLGDLPGALAIDQESLRMLRERIKGDGNARDKRDLSIVLSKIGGLARRTGDLKLADSALRESLDLARDLASDESNSSAQNDLVIALIALEEVEFAEGDDRSALPLQTEILGIRRKQMKGDDPRSAALLSLALQRLGAVKQRMGDVKDALAHDEEALEIARRVRKKDGSRRWTRDVAVALNIVGDAKLALADRDGARAAYLESLEICRKLATGLADDTGQYDVIYTLGKVAALSNDPKPFYEEALPHAVSWRRLRPDSKVVEGILDKIKKALVVDPKR